MKKLQKFLSLALVLLVVTSAAVPAASAQIFVVPATANMVIGGVTVVLSGDVALKLAESLGKVWDNTKEGWDRLMEETSTELNNRISAKKWIDTTPEKIRAIINVVYEYYTSGSGGDGKWYYEARLNHGALEINIGKRMDVNEAVAAMGQGKQIMTLTEKLARNAVERFGVLFKQATNKLESEGMEEYLRHFNYEVQGKQLHCWYWK